MVTVRTTKQKGQIDLSFIVLAVLVIGALVWATHARNEVWTDDIRLWMNTVKKSPNKPRPYNNVGTALMKMKLYDDAVPWIVTAVSKIKGESKDQGSGEALNNLAILCARVGKYDEAIIHLRKARNIYPYSPEIRNNLGIYYEAIGRREEAIKELKEAIRINPYFELAKINLKRVEKTPAK